MTTDRDDKRLRFVQAVTEPPAGFINHYRDCWWATDPDLGLIFYKQTPQCNRNEDVARLVIGKLYPWAEIKFFPSVFVPVNLRDYCDC